MSDFSDRLIQQLSFAIRNPINVIMGTLDLHRTTQMTPEQEHCLDMVQRSAQQLMDASDSLLDLYELNSGGIRAEPQEFNLEELVLEAVKFRKTAAAAKGLKMDVFVDSSIINPCVADPFLVRKALSQLLDNAIKFTEKGSIEVHVRRAEIPPSGQVDRPHICIEVKDTGIGIAHNRLEKLFEGPSEEISYRCGFDGTGLGLLLVSRMVRKLEASVEVESEPGEGSIFRFLFPVQPVEKRVSSDMQLTGGEDKPHTKGIRILCAEDDPDSRYLVEHHLRAMGWQVRLASNGKEALEACRNQVFDIILMDVQMPEMDGFEATTEIRKLSGEGGGTQGSVVPIVALTAHALKQDRDICLQTGMDDYLSKPVHREEMYSIIEYHLRAALQRREV